MIAIGMAIWPEIARAKVTAGLTWPPDEFAAM